MVDYLRILRPRQWIKNIFIFAGLVFSRHFYYPQSIRLSTYAFIIFCLLSGGGYIINDILDYEEDRVHPEKSKRPISAGRITKPIAGLWALVLLTISLVWAFKINGSFFFTCLLYLFFSVSYSLYIKRVVILDVLFVSIGYVLRAIAGAVVIGVEISSWLFLCTLLLALFLVVSKRRTEIILLGKEATKHRKILSQYSVELLNQMIAIVTSACVVSYCLYTLSPQTIEKFGTKNLILTIPFVIYGIFRYLYVTFQKLQSDIPEKAIIGDRPLQVCVVLWIIICILILR